MEAPTLDNTLETELVTLKVEEENISPRIAIEMNEEDQEDLDFIMGSIEQKIRQDYLNIFKLEEDLIGKVRVVNPPNLGGGYMRRPDGSYVENWEQLQIKDLETFINAASAEAFFASQMVIDSYAEAVFSKYAYDDAYDQEYSALLTGTISDKSAKAKRKTQKERWIALYKTLYYKKAKEALDKLESHVRRVEKIYIERQKEVDRNFRATRQLGGGR